MYKVLLDRKVLSDSSHTVTLESDCLACLRETVISLPMKFDIYAVYRHGENITRRSDIVSLMRDREIRQGVNPVGANR